jgi:hypothetical protein
MEKEQAPIPLKCRLHFGLHSYCGCCASLCKHQQLQSSEFEASTFHSFKSHSHSLRMMELRMNGFLSCEQIVEGYESCT